MICFPVRDIVYFNGGMNMIDSEVSDLFFNLEFEDNSHADHDSQEYADRRAKELKAAYPCTFADYTEAELAADWLHRL
jgi:hypothetical protein